MGERSSFQTQDGRIFWRLRLQAAPEQVYDHIATDTGRARFWAEYTETAPDGTVVFHLLNEPKRIESVVLEADRPRRYALKYFADSTAEFELTADGDGGTDLALTARNVPEAFLTEMTAGWVTVLMALKGAVDFDVDLRNHDARRTWDQRYVND